jgi:hypothetical protein
MQIHSVGIDLGKTSPGSGGRSRQGASEEEVHAEATLDIRLCAADSICGPP